MQFVLTATWNQVFTRAPWAGMCSGCGLLEKAKSHSRSQDTTEVIREIRKWLDSLAKCRVTENFTMLKAQN